PAIDNRRGQRRLQAEDQRDHSSRQPVLDRDEHAAETKAMHHQAGDRAVRHTARARPFGPREREYRAKQHHDDAHAQRQERQRFGISKPKLGADNARSPQHDEYAGRREYDEVFQSARHERGHLSCERRRLAMINLVEDDACPLRSLASKALRFSIGFWCKPRPREIQYHYFAVYRDLLLLSSNRNAVLMSSYVSSCLSAPDAVVY